MNSIQAEVKDVLQNDMSITNSSINLFTEPMKMNHRMIQIGSNPYLIPIKYSIIYYSKPPLIRILISDQASLI